MLEVKVARHAGFCFGVKRAVDKVYELIETQERPIYTLGPIIHNESVVEDLESKGVRVLKGVEEFPKVGDGVVVIRSHGVGREVYRRMEQLGISYVDVTCPNVLKIHKIVERESKAGKNIVIIGNAKHPEVEGICGWSVTTPTVIETVQEALNYSANPGKSLCIVSQTTFNYNKFKELVEILEKKRYDNNVLNTICNATEDRQRETKQIAKEVDTMLVIGGKHSSNTQKLYEISRCECGNTYYIQSPVDLDSEMFQSSSCVGITAGASTPNKIIEEVQKHVRIKF